MAVPMHGRDRELAAVMGVLDGARDGRGAALVVRGHAGTGKTTLLTAARRAAGAAGMTVLRADGVPAETALPYAGLHQLLTPLRTDRPALTPRLQRTLRGAFGEDDIRPDPFSAGLATLELLTVRAARGPLLLLAEDAQWLDPPTLDVLVFVGRRLRAEPIAALLAVRSQHTMILSKTGLRQLYLPELDDTTARRILQDRAPALSPARRDRILAAAAGNPLALVELPSLLTPADPDAPPDPNSPDDPPGSPRPLVEPAHLPATAGLDDPAGLPPLNERLESAFSDRYAPLPATTRAVLAVLAAGPDTALPALLNIAATVAGTEVTAAAIQPAIDAGLLLLHGRHLRFRHPLVRAAVYRATGVIARIGIHTALAAALSADPDRSAWHRSASALGPDEAVSADLEAAARRARERGAFGAAVTGLDRAAELTTDPARRTSLRLDAADLAAQLPDRRVAARLIAQIEPPAGDAVRQGRNQPSAGDAVGQNPIQPAAGDATRPGRIEPPVDDVVGQGRLALVREIVDPGDLRDVTRIDRLIDLASEACTTGAIDLAAELCRRAAARGWWAGRPPGAAAGIAAVLDRLGLGGDDPRGLAIDAYRDPEAYGAAVLRRLPALVPDRTDLDGLRDLGEAALVLGEFGTAASYLATAAAGYRAQGRTAALSRVLVGGGLAQLWLGRWPAARAALEEAEGLSGEAGEPFWADAARATLALQAAMRGDGDEAVRLAGTALSSPHLGGARFAAAIAQHARAVAALTAGRPDEALELLVRVHDPADPAHHPDLSGWMLPDLADAAVRTGRRDDAWQILARFRDRALRLPSPMLLHCVAYAEAVLGNPPPADHTAAGGARSTRAPGSAEDAFARALAADLTGWPVHRARLQLAFGAWLRRRKRILASRGPLRSAREGFEALGAGAWAETARGELRAAGEPGQGRAADGREQLSAQELQIAGLAAEGLSNREIGQRLFLSHRTVSSHLYRIYPKLGITRRAQLAAAVSG
ncbi:AAA family ATPase [Dactylosporangium sp. NPDC051541]|uniref:helix-turn-helix transcriptional regulator n=1 Tax=Dactylosporangium sp. NPDC051541 TaxID=3363977 RepID=UPI00378D9B8C